MDTRAIVEIIRKQNPISNRLRLLYQYCLSVIAIPLGLNDRLTQFCDRCGRTQRGTMWWDAGGKVWEEVAGNVNGHHHGCFCIRCFSILAKEKGILLRWQPVIEEAGQVADSLEVRIGIVRRIESGEITLVEGQAELKKIKRDAKKNGMITRSQAYRGRRGNRSQSGHLDSIPSRPEIKVTRSKRNGGTVNEYKLCHLCGQPTRPKGVKKLPNEYDHAQGCPYSRKRRKRIPKR